MPSSLAIIGRVRDQIKNPLARTARGRTPGQHPSQPVERDRGYARLAHDRSQRGSFIDAQALAAGRQHDQCIRCLAALVCPADHQRIDVEFADEIPDLRRKLAYTDNGRDHR